MFGLRLFNSVQSSALQFSSTLWFFWWGILNSAEVFDFHFLFASYSNCVWIFLVPIHFLKKLLVKKYGYLFVEESAASFLDNMVRGRNELFFPMILYCFCHILDFLQVLLSVLPLHVYKGCLPLSIYVLLQKHCFVERATQVHTLSKPFPVPVVEPSILIHDVGLSPGLILTVLSLCPLHPNPLSHLQLFSLFSRAICVYKLTVPSAALVRVLLFIYAVCPLLI